MAHFAELDSNNKVLRVVVISNENVASNGGDKSTQAETFVKNLLGHSENGVTWKQTSYNRTFRRNFAGPDSVYDPSRDIFIQPKPFPSWVENLKGTSEDGYSDWDAPVAWPGADVEYTDPWGNKSPYYWNWNEDNGRWEGTKIYDKDENDGGIFKLVYWDNSTSTVRDI